ncbi:hypothetical protein Rs2_36998 [Raphanus sativus]|uniref:Uncharacterized protein LOC108819390 isoform X2 n=1 Tax=Raphanus sativus TaxID=3726 RepID=A0A6J0KJ44_RAPSA|nr:uncharacterized protein LOC108819390 isoform X2 [Raphanus sativus]KAJ4879944.1 hypothetical protein Rs2_36998 [Raphanus sativus]
MPPGAKKRKALKKKQQLQQEQEEAIGTNNLGGNVEHGSQDDSNLSSPGSQGNEQFGGTKDQSGVDVVEKNVSSQHPCDKEIAPVVSKVVISEKRRKEHAIDKSGEARENGKVAATLLEPATGKVESARESQVPLSSDEKRLLFPRPPPVRTSWFSCCGLFDAMTDKHRTAGMR